MDWKRVIRGFGIDVYFSICPLCLSENSIKSELGLGGFFSKDHITCSKCGAKWDVGIGKTGFSYGNLKWAKLVVDGVDGKGSEFLNKKKKPEFWQHLGLKGKRELEATKEKTNALRVEEEKQIEGDASKFFCRYCGAANKDDAVFCEKCGKKIS